MTTKQELEALAERVERLTGPDREAEVAIARIMEKLGPWSDWTGEKLARTIAVVPAYTSSLDAAITLVPEGWGQSMHSGYRTNPDMRTATLLHPTEGLRDVRADSLTMSLALTAAALRARAQEMNDEAD